MRCAICLRTFGHPRFNSPRIKICGIYVNSLNNYHAVAEEGYKALAEYLRFGIRQRALEEANDSTDLRRAERARHTLATLDQACAAALPRWIKNAAADSRWRKKPNKLIRAHRRGLLHYDRPHNGGYPANWPDIASRIRLLDRFQCVGCGAQNEELHVHHIVYLSNFGTHRKTNLISLCRPCHEAEHGHALDFGERADGLIAPERTTTPGMTQLAQAPETDFGNHLNVALLQAPPPQIQQPSAAVNVAANHPIAPEPAAPAIGSPERQKREVAHLSDAPRSDVWPWIAIALGALLVLVALCF